MESGTGSKSGAGSSSSSSSTTKSSVKFDRLQRLRDLHSKRNEARKLNHQEVLEEERRAKLPSNYEAKRRKADWILEEEEKKEKCRETGEDYDRMKLLDEQADDLEKLNRLRARKKNPDQGFSNYEDSTIRQHKRLVQNMKTDLVGYEEEKGKLGEEMFYASRNTIVHGVHVDKEENIDRMVADINKQVEKREKYSRRRVHNDEADIDYINERNMKFNKKLERFYGQYTSEIKQNLERGTAI